jgi:ribosomal protein S18 acetylase RimI-like enzyme
MAEGLAPAVIVRDARPADHATIDRLIEAAYGEFAPRLEPGGWDRMRQSLAAARLVAGGARLMVAEKEGNVLGSVAYYPPGRSTPTIFQSEWASLRALAVEPQARGRGIGRRLTEAAIERARQDGAGIIGLHTSEAMTVARGLYQRMGFALVSELPTYLGLRYWLFRKEIA